MTTAGAWPPLTVRQRRFRRWCAAGLLAGIACILLGAVAFAGRSGSMYAVAGAVAVVFGAQLVGSAILSWPTRWRTGYGRFDLR